MRIGFRVDASIGMGTGHLVRCRTLAQQLRRRGAEVQFICRAHPGALPELVARDGIPVTLLPPPSSRSDVGDDYADWLGVSQQQDATETIAAIGRQKLDWLVVDHYGIDSEWENAVRSSANRIMAIDDLANRQHTSDILLDQNYSADGSARYADLVSSECRLFLGPRYALLQSQYSACRFSAQHRQEEVRRVLVYFGGSDIADFTAMALNALDSEEFRHLDVDVVVGANYAFFDQTRRLIARRPNVRLHGPRPHLADLMATADIAIGAGGATTWERMCLGVPSIVISLAENQERSCEALATDGLIEYLGSAESVTDTSLAESLRRMCGNPEGREKQSERSRLLVDGLGTMRMAEALFPSSVVDLRIRPAVEREEHKTQLFCSDVSTFELEAGNLAVGQISFTQKTGNEEVEVDCAIDALVQEQSWSDRLLELGIRAFNARQPIVLDPETKDGLIQAAPPFLRSLSVWNQKSERQFSIVILSDNNSWINKMLPRLIRSWIDEGHRVLWVHDVQRVRSADVCFCLSFSQIVPIGVRDLFSHTLVVHESDLPHGKGWSPLTWSILEGRDKVAVTLIEAADKVDSGVIYAQRWIDFEGHELVHELREVQAAATFELCKTFLNDYPSIVRNACEQSGEESFYPRRRPRDSRLHADQTLQQQFSLLRVVDNERYPAFFELNGFRYTLRINKIE